MLEVTSWSLATLCSAPIALVSQTSSSSSTQSGFDPVPAWHTGPCHSAYCQETCWSHQPESPEKAHVCPCCTLWKVKFAPRLTVLSIPALPFLELWKGGQRMTFEELYTIWRDHLASARQSQIVLGPDDIPSLSALEQAYRRVKRGKALGQDNIPPEVCGACPTTLARQTFSLLVKMMAHGQESLHHKGGTLNPAYKGKGSTLAPTSYRSLLISSHPGKALHRTIRQHQTQLYEQYLCRQQLGGRQHVPVNLGLHEARAFLRRGQNQGLSVGLLMLDLTEAFYRVLRPLAVGCAWTDDQIAALAQKLCLSDTALQDLYRHLQEPSAIDRAQLPAHMTRIIKSLHTDTYFQVPGQKDFCHTTIGSRPGDCFADVEFSYLFSRVLQDFQAQVQALGLQEMLPVYHQFNPYQMHELPPAAEEFMPYMGPVWMDDLCIGITASTPDALISKAGTITAILLETLEGYGMTPNLKRGKTELLLSLRGPGMRRCRRERFGPQTDGTLPVICESGTKFISVVGQYQHLGGLIHHAGDHRQEMRRRIAIANEAFNAHRRNIFQNMGIPLCKRIELFNTLILSKLLLVVSHGSWQRSKTRSIYMRPWCVCTGDWTVALQQTIVLIMMCARLCSSPLPQSSYAKFASVI